MLMGLYIYIPLEMILVTWMCFFNINSYKVNYAPKPSSGSAETREKHNKIKVTVSAADVVYLNLVFDVK